MARLRLSKWAKGLAQEIDNPLTYDVQISRGFDNKGTTLTVVVKQTAPVEYFGTPEMREGNDEVPIGYVDIPDSIKGTGYYTPMDIPPPDPSARKRRKKT